MNRRLFLSALAAAAATAVLDPERLLWMPTKTIFIPPVPVFRNELFGVDFEFSIQDAMRIVLEHEERMRAEAVRDLKFIAGDVWGREIVVDTICRGQFEFS